MDPFILCGRTEKMKNKTKTVKNTKKLQRYRFESGKRVVHADETDSDDGRHVMGKNTARSSLGFCAGVNGVGRVLDA